MSTQQIEPTDAPEAPALKESVWSALIKVGLLLIIPTLLILAVKVFFH